MAIRLFVCKKRRWRISNPILYHSTNCDITSHVHGICRGTIHSKRTNRSAQTFVPSLEGHRCCHRCDALLSNHILHCDYRLGSLLHVRIVWLRSAVENVQQLVEYRKMLGWFARSFHAINKRHSFALRRIL